MYLLTQGATGGGLPGTPNARPNSSPAGGLPGTLRQDYAPPPPPMPGPRFRRPTGYRIPVLPQRERPMRSVSELLGLPTSPEAEHKALYDRLLKAAIAEREAVSRRVTEVQEEAVGTPEAERKALYDSLLKAAVAEREAASRRVAEAKIKTQVTPEVERSSPTERAMKTAQMERPPIVDEMAGPVGLPQLDGGNPSSALFDAGPPTDQPVDVFEMYRKLGFDPGGPGEWTVGPQRVFEWDKFLDTAAEAEEATARRFPGVDPHNNPADAFKHALWSYKMTKAKNAIFAKKITDAIEISYPGDHPGDRLMDLYNNNVGRQLAMDPRYEGRDDEEVILEALEDGKLQTHYFNVLRDPPELAVPPILNPYGYRGRR